MPSSFSCPFRRLEEPLNECPTASKVTGCAAGSRWRHGICLRQFCREAGLVLQRQHVACVSFQSLAARECHYPRAEMAS